MKQAAAAIKTAFKTSSTVLIEDYIAGFEFSQMVLVGGEHYALLPTAQDHKRLQDHDRGPNTGGMGPIHQYRKSRPRLSIKRLRQLLNRRLQVSKPMG